MTVPELRLATTNRARVYRPDLKVVVHVWDPAAPANPPDYHYGVTALCGADRGLYARPGRWPKVPERLDGRLTRVCPACRRKADARLALEEAGRG